jgi:hypothetical protein
MMITFFTLRQTVQCCQLYFGCKLRCCGSLIKKLTIFININNRNYNLFQNQKSTNSAFYLENTTENVADFCF